MTPAFRIVALTSRHPRGNSTCGVAALDAYFRTQVTQDIRRRITTCFVAIDNASAEVAGSDTLAAGAIALDDVPAAFALVADATDAAAASFYRLPASMPQWHGLPDPPLPAALGHAKFRA